MAGSSHLTTKIWRWLPTAWRAARWLPTIKRRIVRRFHPDRVVLFGSQARGKAGARSDIDLLVRIERKHDLALARLALRLSDRIGRRVQLVSLEDGEKSSLLLADVLRDGRIVIDRDGDWSRLRRRESAITRDARRRSDELERAAWATLESLP